MTITTHATIGAVIGQATGSPEVAFSLGMASHFLVDMIPHGDTGLSDNFRIHKRRRKHAMAYAIIDGIVAVFFVLLLANVRDLSATPAFTWGIVGSVLPDLLIGVYEITKTPWLRWFNKMHFWFHNYFVKRRGDVPLYYAILAQVVLIAYLQTKL